MATICEDVSGKMERTDDLNNHCSTAIPIPSYTIQKLQQWNHDNFPAEFSYFAWATSPHDAYHASVAFPTTAATAIPRWDLQQNHPTNRRRTRKTNTKMISITFVLNKICCVQTFGTRVVNNLWFAQIPDLLNCEPFINGSQVPKMKVFTTLSLHCTI